MSSVKLRIIYADGRREERTLDPSVYQIGRDAGDIILGDVNVSSSHARLEVHSGKVTITDLGSTNGTFDDAEQRVSGAYVMQPFRSVRLGASKIELLPTIGATQVTPTVSKASPAQGLPHPAASSTAVPPSQASSSTAEPASSFPHAGG